MIKVVKHFRYNQNFIPCGLSSLASGLYTCIKLCNYAPPPKKVAGYYVIPSEILSVRPSIRPSVSAPTIRLPATPPTVFGQSFSNFTGAFRMVRRYAYFSESWNYFLSHFFFIFNLDFFQALILQKCIGSMYLLPATPPTVLGQSFWNFTHAFRMVWRYAYCFFRILKLFFITFYCILT